MECLRFYDNEYIRECFKMAKDKKSNASNFINSNMGENKESQTMEELVNKVEEMSRKLEELNQKSPAEKILGNWKVMFAMGGTLVTTAITVAIYILNSFNTINTNIVSMQKDIDMLAVDSTEIKTKVEKMEEYLYLDDGVKDQLGTINEALNIKIINVTDENASAAIGASIERKDVNYVASGFWGEARIGVDADGNVYIAKDLIGEKVLLTYREDDKEVYFLGQYNENYHWDGYCVTNAYNSDGNLYGICESNFDDGKRLDYISLYSDGDAEWIYAKRELDDNENVGITINYRIKGNKEKNFTATNVRISDILYADDYIESTDKNVIKYYTGNTMNNVFNDYTGNAYEVKYDEDGTVRMLYFGRFEDGYCEDATGDAFSIVYSDEYNAYFYNSGKFSKGTAEKHSVEPIAVDEIKQMIKDYPVDCKLDWKEEK